MQALNIYKQHEKMQRHKVKALQSAKPKYFVTVFKANLFLMTCGPKKD